jgi:hypothetical protein
VVIPLFSREKSYLPDAARIVRTVRKMMNN